MFASSDKLDMDATSQLPLEFHPWQPFIPDGARLLLLGTFPPQPKRWSMNFYYPNPTNDFWSIMGLIFMGDRNALKNKEERGFSLSAVRELLTEKKIALADTGLAVRRLRNNASDKYLEIVEPLPLQRLLENMPCCHNIATTGEKAAAVVAEITHTTAPAMGISVTSDTGLHIWRMPSTSRAYPLPIEKKAEFYATLFRASRIL